MTPVELLKQKQKSRKRNKQRARYATNVLRAADEASRVPRSRPPLPKRGRTAGSAAWTGP